MVDPPPRSPSSPAEVLLAFKDAREARAIAARIEDVATVRLVDTPEGLGIAIRAAHGFACAVVGDDLDDPIELAEQATRSHTGTFVLCCGAPRHEVERWATQIAIVPRASLVPIVRTLLSWRPQRSALDRSVSRLQIDWSLTTRETEVLASAAAGHDADLTAKELGISLHTVYAHTRSIGKKSGLGMQGAVRRAWAITCGPARREPTNRSQ